MNRKWWSSVPTCIMMLILTWLAPGTTALAPTVRISASASITQVRAASHHLNHLYVICSIVLWINTHLTYSPDKPEVPDLKDNFTANNHTFKVIQQENLTWADAHWLCQNYSMSLVSIPDAYVQALLTVEVSRRQQPLWIGLFSEDVSEDHMASNPDKYHVFKWTAKWKWISKKLIIIRA